MLNSSMILSHSNGFEGNRRSVSNTWPQDSFEVQLKEIRRVHLIITRI